MSEFGRRVEEQIPSLRRYARALTHDREQADDLVQNCLSRAFAKQHLWEHSSDLRAWLFTILHHERVNDLRRLVRQEACTEAASTLLMTVSRQPDDRLELRDLDRAIAKLPEHQRRVLLLICLEGLGYDQVAAILSLPIGTIRSRLARARETLRQQLSRQRSRAGEPLCCPDRLVGQKQRRSANSFRASA
jgi:RNA polymerase sigma-70 factor, ECF subfamily